MTQHASSRSRPRGPASASDDVANNQHCVRLVNQMAGQVKDGLQLARGLAFSAVTTVAGSRRTEVRCATEVSGHLDMQGNGKDIWRASWLSALASLRSANDIRRE